VITLLDGPAAGAKLALHRAPVFLRVVIDRATGAVDALDQLDDTPRDGEDVHVYQGDRDHLFTLRADVFLCTRGPDGLRAVPTARGEYRHLPDVDGEQLRGIGNWRAWVLERVRTVEGRAPVEPTAESELAGWGHQP